MSRLSPIIVLLLVTLPASAQTTKDSPDVQIAMNYLLDRKPLSIETQKKISFTLLENSGEINDLLHGLQGQKPDSTAARAGQAIQRLQKWQSQSVIHGATLGWSLITEDRKFTTLPLVIKVSPNSPAADAGLLAGDVIDQCAGKDLKSDDSRNRLLLFLNQWPKSEPLELKVRRNSMADANQNMPKNTRKTLTLIPGK